MSKKKYNLSKIKNVPLLRLILSWNKTIIRIYSVHTLSSKGEKGKNDPSYSIYESSCQAFECLKILDVVKLTAQFVARNGRQFLTQLMNREQRNYQFDFLRPQHSLFQYFTRLLEQYTKVS